MMKVYTGPASKLKPLNERKQPKFKVPGVKKKIKGKLIDEIGIEDTVNINGLIKEYIYLLQLIEWQNPPEERFSEELRLAYYYRDKKTSSHFIFGQYAITMPFEYWKILFREAKKKGWL